MKNALTRIIAFVMVTVIFSSLALTCIYAADDGPKTMLALGDSITTGYGLDNYSGGDTPYLCNSYGNLIAAALKLEGGKTYINKAVNGDTSGDLAKLLPSLEKEVQSAELIVVTIGGNDLLQAIPDVASIIAGKKITDLYEVASVLMSVTPEQFDALGTNSEFVSEISSVLLTFITNMASVGTYLETNAPNARIIFLKQYNPMKGVPGFAEFGDFADAFIDPINATIDAMCQKHGFESLDVPSVINDNAAGLTNMMNYDIHPNAAGHLEIAKLLAAHLGISLNGSEETSTVEPEVTTEPVPETTAEPEVTTEPAPETTAEPVVTTEPESETAQETETVSTPDTTIESVITTEPETTPEVVITTEPVVTTESAVTAAPSDTTSPQTEPEITEAPATDSPETEPQLEVKGCSSYVGSAALIIASVCALIVLKKKNN